MRRRSLVAVDLSIAFRYQSSPGPNAAPELIERLRKIHDEGDMVTADVLEQCFSEANRHIEIRMSSDVGESQLQAFSEDILKIEINGPDQEHFTMIDVPKILKMAEIADSEGVLIMGVLTKPDLVLETATRDTIQKLVLGNLLTKFQTITQNALNGSYDGNPVFTAQPSLKLITTVTKMNEAFSNEFWHKGHKRTTSSTPGANEEEEAYELGKREENAALVQRTLEDYPELCDVVEMEDHEYLEPIASDEDPIAKHIERIYQENQGPELGTFSGTTLAMIFKEQSEKWPLLVQAHVSKSIIVVYDYIAKLLTHVCPDKEICDQLWEHLIMDAVRKAYVRALEQAQFFAANRAGRDAINVQKKRLARLDAVIEEKFPHRDGTEPQLVSTTSLRSLVKDNDNMQQVREDILDVLISYYEVSRKRFVDMICRQAVGHFLLEGEESPLRVFSPEMVFGLGVEQLEFVAGEDACTKERRAMLESEIRSLEADMIVSSKT
ncbi:hypothetical protein J4E91_001296 [Alternaria rosae]|nr:hypothetical protein J4E91_001296 [Alternaria rosae]